jgi:tRNA threonylcarbamoyladenosine biosynthesis protein TsaE
VDGQVAGAVLLDAEPDGRTVHLRRFGLTPVARGRGVAVALVRAGLHAATELGDGRAERAVVIAREELPHTVRFWRQQGFAETSRRSPYVELSRALPRRFTVPTADDMRDLATRVAGLLTAGDVLVLSGDLGAGKTTFTQGLGAALQVRGDVTSPTFVISRVHPSLVGGPDLVHVDAYRLGGAAELDDLDLDTDLDRAVTVVEWGEGLAEDLADSPLEVRITRSAGDEVAEDHDPRTVELEPLGRRWLGVDLGV